jgi:hypothetical protein
MDGHKLTYTFILWGLLQVLMVFYVLNYFHILNGSDDYVWFLGLLSYWICPSVSLKNTNFWKLDLLFSVLLLFQLLSLALRNGPTRIGVSHLLT